jgi:hypothetical protein
MSNETMVSISFKEYDQLLKDSQFLECLRGCGVDNWDGWDYAREAYYEMNPEEE